MPATSRLAWTKAVPEPGGLYFAELGFYTFEISHTLDQGYVLQMWQTRPEASPILFFEVDGFSLDEAKERAERLAGQHVPVILQG